MSVQKGRWSIERGQHYEVLCISVLDNMVLTTSIFLLGYFDLHDREIISGRLRILLYAFPIISLCHVCVVSMVSMVNAIRAFRYKQFGIMLLRKSGISVFDSHPHILTSTVFYRALIVPICA